MWARAPSPLSETPPGTHPSKHPQGLSRDPSHRPSAEPQLCVWRPVCCVGGKGHIPAFAAGGSKKVLAFLLGSRSRTH
eukprot:3530435-Alexandrium_andersonii.AAC.1